MRVYMVFFIYLLFNRRGTHVPKKNTHIFTWFFFIIIILTEGEHMFLRKNNKTCIYLREDIEKCDGGPAAHGLSRLPHENGRVLRWGSFFERANVGI